MNIGSLFEIFPDSLKVHILNFQNVSRIVNGRKQYAVRVIFDTEVKRARLEPLLECKKVLELSVCHPVYAPEIEHQVVILKGRLE